MRVGKGLSRAVVQAGVRGVISAELVVGEKLQEALVIGGGGLGMGVGAQVGQGSPTQVGAKAVELVAQGITPQPGPAVSLADQLAHQRVEVAQRVELRAEPVRRLAGGVQL